MKKWNIKTLILLFLIINVSFLAAVGLQENDSDDQQSSSDDEKEIIVYETVLSGVITEIDKYGNGNTDVTIELIEDSGVEIGDMLYLMIGDDVFEMPFVITYSDVYQGHLLFRVSSSSGLAQIATNFANFSEEYGVGADTEFSISIKEKGVYLAQIEARNMVKKETREEYESDAAFANFRVIELGEIKPGVIYRSSHPVLGDDRSTYTAQLVEENGIKTIINLSDSDEELQELVSNSDYYNSLYQGGSVATIGMGIDLLSGKFAQKVNQALTFMIGKESPYLVHCEEGKDRAGLVSALLEGLMGATVQEILNDYVVTYQNYFLDMESTERYDLVASIMYQQLKDIAGGAEVTDDNVKEVVINYLTNTVGMTLSQIDLLKDKLQ